MVVPPDIFRQVQRQTLLANATFGRQPALEVAPESLQAVDMVVAGVTCVPAAVIDQPMDVALGGNAGVARPHVGADNGASPDATTNEGLQGAARHIRDDLGPDLAATTENAEDRCLEGRATSGRHAAARRPVPPIAPRATQVGFVDLDGALEDGRHGSAHGLADPGEGPQD